MAQESFPEVAPRRFELRGITEEQLAAAMRERIESHWPIKLRDDLSARDLVSVFLAYTEDVDGGSEGIE